MGSEMCIRDSSTIIDYYACEFPSRDLLLSTVKVRMHLRMRLACSIVATVPHADPSWCRPRHSALSAGLSVVLQAQHVPAHDKR